MATMKKLMAFFQKVLSWLKGKKGLITTASVGVGFSLLTASVFIICSVCHNNPGLFQNDEFHSLRADTLQKGTQEPASSSCALWRTAEVVTLEKQNGVFYTVSPESQASDFYEFRVDATWTLRDTSYTFRTYVSNGTCGMRDEIRCPFYLEVDVLTADGGHLKTEEGYSCQVFLLGCFDENRVPLVAEASDRHRYFEDEDWDACQAALTKRAAEAIMSLPSYAESAGYANGETFYKNIIAAFHDTYRLYSFAYAAIPFGTIAVISLSLFFGFLNISRTEVLKKRIEEKAESSKEPLSAPKPLSPRSMSRVMFFEEHHIRPFLGEWFFRAVGLLLVAVGSTMLSLFAKAQSDNWGEGWDQFSLSSSELFRVFNSLGNIALIIVVIGIIAETRRNLNFSAWFFLTLSFVYYIVSCSLVFATELTWGQFGEGLANGFSLSLPGNVFFGIGLFAIIGFFLFYDPPKYAVNRKAFRALVAFPIAAAIVSVAFSYYYQATTNVLSYWIRNFFFIRSAHILFVGILYEVSIFFFHFGMSKRGITQEVGSISKSPYFQFQKNVALCLLIGLLVGIFYLIPAESREYLGIETQHAWFFLLIPFFLFFKPAGINHKKRDDIIYYAIYAVAWALPSLPRIIEFLSRNIVR